MMSMNLMVAIKVELVAISLFALTLGIQQNMKYIIIFGYQYFIIQREKSRGQTFHWASVMVTMKGPR